MRTISCSKKMRMIRNLPLSEHLMHIIVIPCCGMWSVLVSIWILSV